MTKLRIWAVGLVAMTIVAAGIWPGTASTDATTVSEDREVSIVVDADFNPFIDDVATAGTNRVILENETSASFGVSLYFVPDAVLAGLADREGTPEVGSSGLPLWLSEATPVGGPGIAGPSSVSEAFVDLDVGSYVLVFTFFPLEAGQLPSVLLTFDDGSPFVIAVVEAANPTGTPIAVTKTTEPMGTPIAATSTVPIGLPTEVVEPSEDDDEATEGPGDSSDPPPLTATIVMTDGGFLVPGSFASGPQTWEIVNQGQVPHALIVVAIPDGTTVEQLLATLFPGPDRVATSFDLSAMINVGGLGPLAPGLSAGATFDLAAGTYAMFSALPDPVTGQPDGTQGLLVVFVVG